MKTPLILRSWVLDCDDGAVFCVFVTMSKPFIVFIIQKKKKKKVAFKCDRGSALTRAFPIQIVDLHHLTDRIHSS